ncbi:hypothetical protein JQS43_03335 [Natronosporangium hydrolyticum]|uniref:histidine kinase n=1 Tax=Natronosporangium hydrolyticum TaxID=2811111 RepID=A0A895YNA5_9ACTN|nr:histidine kinase [Natronosporangium hydrolyticum]QSB15408.1 hypothetical protein JQS43_03335 [Natronosporangium hydrolyticum]
MTDMVAGRRRRIAGNAAVALGCAAAVFAEGGVWLAADTGVLRPQYLLLCGAAGVLAAAVLARRAAPAWVPLAPAAVMVGLGTIQPAQGPAFMFTIAGTSAALAYLAGTAGQRRTGWGLAGLAVAGSAVAAALGSPGGALFTVVVLLIFGLLPWLLGHYRRQQRALLRARADRIAQLEREQQMVAEQARLRERAALAEEMHDSLGHELSLVALRAGGLELAPDLPDPHRAAVGELRAATATATARLAEIVAVLRGGGQPAESPSDSPAGSLDELVGRARQAGLDVRSTATGEPAASAAPTIHRVVQEGLTNAAKHAPGAAVTVAVHGDADGTSVSVSNPPPPGAAPPAPPGGGHGLAALAERVRLLGGDLSVSRPGGGFQLSIRLPHRVRAEPGYAGEAA